MTYEQHHEILGRLERERPHPDAQALDFAALSLNRVVDGPDRKIVDCKATLQLVHRWPEAGDWITAKRLARVTLAFKMDRSPKS